MPRKKNSPVAPAPASEPQNDLASALTPAPSDLACKLASDPGAKAIPPQQAALPETTTAPSADASLPAPVAVCEQVKAADPENYAGLVCEPKKTPHDSFKPAIYVYLPPNSGRFNTNAFLENLRRNPPKYPLVTISERAEFNPTIKIKNSPAVPGMTGVVDASGNCFAIHNLVWIYAMCFAWRDGVSHVLYLEEDCRASGADWDEAIFNEYLSEQPDALISGTMAVYNPANTNREFWLRYCQLISKYNEGDRTADDATVKDRNFPIATYGWKGKTLPPVAFGNKSQAEKSGSALFVNGAGGIYSIAGFRELFPEITRWDDKNAKFNFATKTGAWDANIGKRVSDKYRERSFDMVHHNPKVYSVFGNAITTEEERLAMLRSGTVRLVHSVKGNVVE